MTLASSSYCSYDSAVFERYVEGFDGGGVGDPVWADCLLPTHAGLAVFPILLIPVDQWPTSFSTLMVALDPPITTSLVAGRRCLCG